MFLHFIAFSFAVFPFTVFFYIKNPKFQYIWEQNIQVKAPAYNGHSLITTFASRFWFS